MTDSLKAFDKVLADLEEIKSKGNFLPDCTTKEGYLASKDFVLKITTPARRALTDAHKGAKAFHLEGGRIVDSKKNELMQVIKDAEKPHQDAYKVKDDNIKRIKAEKEAAIQNGFDLLNGYPSRAIGQPSGSISFLLEECSAFDADPAVYRKEIDNVILLHKKTMGQLSDALTQALQVEDMGRKQAEMDRKQAEFDAIELKRSQESDKENKKIEEAKQRERMRAEAEQMAADEVSRHKLDADNAENRRVAEAEQARVFAEDAKIEAIKQAELAAAQAVQDEKDKQAVEQVKLAEQAKDREADKKHGGAINRQALDCLVQGGMIESEAKLAVKLIASRKVAHVQISY
jgi:hypothetical protein